MILRKLLIQPGMTSSLAKMTTPIVAEQLQKNRCLARQSPRLQMTSQGISSIKNCGFMVATANSMPASFRCPAISEVSVADIKKAATRLKFCNFIP